MNYYFLLEDEKSFMKILPNWFEYMEFDCVRVADIKQVRENNYILQSGKGVTRLITKALFDTIDTIIENPGKIDKLVIIIDTENENEEYRKKDIFTKIKEKYVNESFDFEILIFVCNHCFESWLLGAKGIYPQCKVAADTDFYPYYVHYNIEKDDPELMSVPNKCNETIAKYHFHYLHELFRYRKVRYSKSKPNAVATKEYFKTMCERIEKTSHIPSFAKFIEFIRVERQMSAQAEDV